MLNKLKIENIGIITNNVIEFDKGFNILSGETGAGKSLIVDSLNFLMGCRFDKSIIRTNETYSFVEGVFEIYNSQSIIEVLKAFDLSFENIVILSRNTTMDGKNICKYNGELITLNMLKKISSCLIDVFGQHDSMTILDTNKHIALLDDYCKFELTDSLSKINDEYVKLNNIYSKLKELGDNDYNRARMIGLLNYEITEIENANLLIDEEENLIKERIKMQNSQKINDSLVETINILSDENDVINLIKQSANSVQNISEYFDEANIIKDRLNSDRYDLIDIVETLRTILEDNSYNQETFDKILDRLEIISHLKRKYGKNISDILIYLSTAKEKLNILENCDSEIILLNNEKEKVLKNLFNESLILSNIRKKYAKELENNIIFELKELGMPNAKFKINFADFFINDTERLITKNGMDKVLFLFSANLGQDLKDITKVISGGEMSRFMLAYTTITKKSFDKTIIFDEIDTGIGGRVGTSVGNKISKLSLNNQVICITHLAQIACFGDANYKIDKIEKDNNTYTLVKRVKDKEKINEIIRMIGSDSDKNYAVKYAEELLNDSCAFKEQIR